MIFLVVKCSVMPEIIILDKVDAAALKGIADDHYGFVGLILESKVDSLAKLFNIITVDFLNDKAESRPFVAERLEFHNVLGSAVNHALVAVNEAYHVGYFIMRRRHSSFPV